MRFRLFAVFFLAQAAASGAQEAVPATSETIADYAGKWQIQDAGGAKSCDLTLTTGEAIGGYVIEIAETCGETFPVMNEIAAWRMFENGDIVFADATRKERLRFYTPDDSYISVEEVDGIVRLVPASQ